ncbi:patatin-like phospholipase family protein [Streptomyces sp. NPDC051776]|uniref:patatin-like phospholipase family protein n=1 Tax=Streptomyces sp. NPDC051776 TaxID=3155414 RepID=UPI003436F6DE
MATTALVLGGGGITGVGWEIGMLTGLAASGVDVSTADTVIGTSAGSVVGAQLTSGRLALEELYERQLADATGEIAARMGRMTIARYALGALRSRDGAEFGARMGRLALAARTPDEAERRAVIEQRLVAHEWPGRRLLITAVNAATGEFAAFDGSRGVGLVDAVAASCAVPGVWPPVTIDGGRWIDGGVRSAANADLASGHERVVILAPMTQGGGPVPSARAQAATLTAAGARVVLLAPDRVARSAIGRNPLDPARRAPAARAGRAQAAAHAKAVAAVWDV